MDLWASFSNSGVYLAVLAGGYLLKRAGLFRVQDARFLSAVIMNITLPAAIVKGFAGVELSGVLLLTFVFARVRCFPTGVRQWNGERRS